MREFNEKPRRIRDEKVLKRARQRACEWPGCTWTFFKVHAAHIKSKGSGGDDADENVISLCVRHHSMHHSGQIKSQELRDIVARRK